MRVYGWDLVPVESNPLRDDMMVALNEIITHNNNNELMVVIRMLGGEEGNLISQTIVYGFLKECDALWREVDHYILEKFSFDDLNEDFWGPSADLGSAWGNDLLNQTFLCFYKGVLYNGTYKGGYTGQ